MQVLIVGGGDGGVLREVAKHKGVTEVRFHNNFGHTPLFTLWTALSFADDAVLH